jgi:hypothetical protein
MLRCSLGRHRWQTVRAGAQEGRECRDCKARNFDDPTSRAQEDVKNLLGGLGPN